MQHGGAGCDAAELRDEREERVPERKRVAGVQASVAELVHGTERERAEVVELAHAREMLERVAVDDAGHVPERDPEHEPAGDDECTRRQLLGRALAAHERDRGDRHDGEQDERQRKRRVHRERDGERGGKRGQRPAERRGGAPLPERPRHEPSRHEQDERRREQAQPDPERAAGRDQPRDAQQEQRAERRRRRLPAVHQPARVRRTTGSQRIAASAPRMRPIKPPTAVEFR